VKVFAHKPFDLKLCNDPVGHVTWELVDGAHLARRQVKEARHGSL
jgi:hypothetical protein